VPPEPVITFFGVARADDTLVNPAEVLPQGVPIFLRPSFGFSLVVEGRPGGTGAMIGGSTFNTNPIGENVFPDLQIEVSRPLGDGSPAVCDDIPPTLGGVPAIDPPDFSPTQAAGNAVNDLACRFKDGFGLRSGRGPSDSCVRFADGLFRFVAPASTLQFCGAINRPIGFPEGDTTVTVRIRDVRGNVSAVAQLVIRVEVP
jgi:hypothetical protein